MKVYYVPGTGLNALCSFSHLLNLHNCPMRQKILLLLFSAEEPEV